MLGGSEFRLRQGLAGASRLYAPDGAARRWLARGHRLMWSETLFLRLHQGDMQLIQLLLRDLPKWPQPFGEP